jgi:predicted AlkP superfamily phosphohydrolase/phosphomutase
MQEQFTQAKERMETELFSTAIDWEKSQAYAIGACGNIFINLVGREPAGIVEPGTPYEELRNLIIDRLAELRDPENDQPLVKEVLRREDVYHGKYLEDAPDLVVIWHDYGFWGRARYDQHRPDLFEPSSTWDFSTLPLTGTHRPEGIIMASGPGIQKQATVDGAQLIDLAPTILAYLGIPIPRGFDGRALEDLFEKEILEILFDDDDSDDPSGSFGFTAEEEAKVKQHLENLGYL